MQVSSRAVPSLGGAAKTTLEFTKKHPLLVTAAVAATVTAYMGGFNFGSDLPRLPERIGEFHRISFFERASYNFLEKPLEGSVCFFTFVAICKISLPCWNYKLDSLGRKAAFGILQVCNLGALGINYLFFNKEIPTGSETN